MDSELLLAAATWRQDIPIADFFDAGGGGGSTWVVVTFQVHQVSMLYFVSVQPKNWPFRKVYRYIHESL